MANIVAKAGSTDAKNIISYENKAEICPRQNTAQKKAYQIGKPFITINYRMRP
jgi:hypothetical protein